MVRPQAIVELDLFFLTPDNLPVPQIPIDLFAWLHWFFRCWYHSAACSSLSEWKARHPTLTACLLNPAGPEATPLWRKPIQCCRNLWMLGRKLQHQPFSHSRADCRSSVPCSPIFSSFSVSAVISLLLVSCLQAVYVCYLLLLHGSPSR